MILNSDLNSYYTWYTFFKPPKNTLIKPDVDEALPDWWETHAIPFRNPGDDEVATAWRSWRWNAIDVAWQGQSASETRSDLKNPGVADAQIPVTGKKHKGHVNQ